MPDDWNWFFASEYGRDKMLRAEVESLSYQASAAASRASRMQRELSKLQGTLESRLSVLTKAFYAYVELGDVREELAGYPDTSAIRRDVIAAIEAMSNGVPATPVDSRGLDYWLPEATNTVIRIVSGEQVEQAERPTATSPDAELYIVAAAGALGYGERVADRLPQLLITDRQFTGNQVVLLEAVMAGVYGDGVLDSLEPAFAPLLRGTDASGWLDWVQESASTQDPDRSLEWIRDQLEPREPGSSTAPAEREHPGEDTADERADLRAMVTRFIGAGYGAEGGLLARSRELRWEIEHPGQELPEEEQGPPPAPVLDRLRHYVKTLPVESAEHRTLIRWLAPGLRTTIDPLISGPAPSPAVVSVRTYHGSVDVTAAGPDDSRWQRLTTSIEQSGILPPGRLYGYGIAAGVGAVLALVLALVGQPVLAVLAIIAAVVCGVLCALQLKARHEAAESAKVALEHAHEEVNEGVERAKQVDAAAVEAGQDRSRLADHLRLELGRRADPESAGADSGVSGVGAVGG